jgi:restriction system protein
MIPDYQTLMLPVLKAAIDGEISTKEVISSLAETYKLSTEDREQLLPSGKQRTFDNRVNWAKSYLKQAGLISYPSRGAYKLTEEGIRILGKSPTRIDSAYLERFAAFQEFKSRKGNTADPVTSSVSHDAIEAITPDELIRTTYRQINETLASELLERVRNATPKFFEELLVELLLAMGYGGSSEDAARAIGQSGDGGIDGVIDQDPLGIDQLYIQAKRYADGNNIGSGQIRDFFGALNIKKAQKGLFVTTSSFSSSAIQTAKDLGMRIVLIDGVQLAKLMIRYNIGCRDEDVLHLKKIDEDYFG